MVYLSSITTKTGDGGETSLGDGSRVGKDSLRVAAFGDVDELNSYLGLVRADVPQVPDYEFLGVIQNDLFDVGADLCVPITDGETGKLRVVATQVERLEVAIERINSSLDPLRSFILPGGTPAAARLHVARTVCRRAERLVVALMKVETVNTQVLIYLNRLSDYLFVLARKANDEGRADVLWVPGASR